MLFQSKKYRDAARPPHSIIDLDANAIMNGSLVPRASRSRFRSPDAGDFLPWEKFRPLFPPPHPLATAKENPKPYEEVIAESPASS
ncbi:MAG: hypothetical protein ABSC47_04100 [Terracidiphilus sp.]|jgi:hypothetical protein